MARTGVGCGLIENEGVNGQQDSEKEPSELAERVRKIGVAESGILSIIKSKGCRGGCRKGIADEEAIETEPELYPALKTFLMSEGYR